MLETMRFKKKWIKWVDQCIQSGKFSILMKAGHEDGLVVTMLSAQGGQLFPVLFVIVAHLLSVIVAHLLYLKFSA